MMMMMIGPLKWPQHWVATYVVTLSAGKGLYLVIGFVRDISEILAFNRFGEWGK